MSDVMNAIWLHQPWPTLIEIGVKDWETRGQPPNGSMRPAGVRGMPGLAIEPGERIAIVAAVKAPVTEQIGRYDVQQHTRPEPYDWYGTELSPGDWYTYERPPEPGTVWSISTLPLGVVVCTAVVAEALPIIGDDDMRPEWPGYIVNDGYRLTVHSIAQGRDGDGEWVSEDITDQLPYGDWRPGRWAWRLTDVESVPSRPEPVVVRGNRQGVCEIEVTS